MRLFAYGATYLVLGVLLFLFGWAATHGVDYAMHIVIPASLAGAWAFVKVLKWVDHVEGYGRTAPVVRLEVVPPPPVPARTTLVYAMVTVMLVSWIAGLVVGSLTAVPRPGA
jgi:hypothetical protein